LFGQNFSASFLKQILEELSKAEIILKHFADMRLFKKPILSGLTHVSNDSNRGATGGRGLIRVLE
jgi:hypothetical protein